MTKVRCFKMPFKSNHFNQNQKVWVLWMTGAQAAFCYGRYRGRGRYIRAWVRWDAKYKTPPTFKEFEVDEEFETRMYGRRMS